MFEQFPYVNFHELNLDWLIKTMRITQEAASSTADALEKLKDGGIVTSVNGQTGDVEISVVGADTSIVNVKTEHGAVGDGVTDDTDAIQEAIEHARTSGKILYFPKGVYALGHTKFNTDNYHVAAALHIYSGMTMLGSGATLLATSEDVTHILFTHNEDSATGYNGCNNVYIRGVNFDGNANLTQPITLISTSHAQNILIEKCEFSNCRTWHNIEVNSSQIVTIKDCVFNPSSASEDIQIDTAGADLGNLGQNDGTVCQYIDICGCTFTAGGNYKLAVGNHSAGAHHNIIIHDNFMIGPFSASNGTPVNFVSQTYQVFVYNNDLVSASIPRSTNVNQFNNIFDGRADVPVYPNSINILNDAQIDLNQVFLNQAIGAITIVFYEYSRDLNGPTGASNGVLLSIRNPTSGNFGIQYLFTNNKDYCRRIYNYGTQTFEEWRVIRGYDIINSQIENADTNKYSFSNTAQKLLVTKSANSMINLALNFYIVPGTYAQGTAILRGFPAPEKPVPVALNGDSVNLRCIIDTSGVLKFDSAYTLSANTWIGCNASYMAYVEQV